MKSSLAGASNRTAQPQNPASIRRDFRPDTADITAAQTRWLVSPSPLHTPTLANRADQHADESDEHGGINPNFRAYYVRTSTPPGPIDAFALVTGLRPQNLMTAKTGQFGYPHRVYQEGL